MVIYNKRGSRNAASLSIWLNQKLVVPLRCVEYISLNTLNILLCIEYFYNRNKESVLHCIIICIWTIYHNQNIIYSMYKRILFVLSLTISMLAYADSMPMGSVYVSSANHDSLFVDNNFVGFTPAWLKLPDGSYEVKVTSENNVSDTKRLLFEHTDSKQSAWVKFHTKPVLKPTWAKDITPAEKSVIEDILENMEYMPKGKFYKDEFRSLHLGEKYQDSIYEGSAWDIVRVPDFYVMNWTISIYDWEIIMDTVLLPSRIPVSIRREAAMRGQSLTIDRIEKFAQRVRYLSGLPFSLPSVFQLVSYYPSEEHINSSYPIMKTEEFGNMYSKNDRYERISERGQDMYYNFGGEYIGEPRTSRVYYQDSYNRVDYTTSQLYRNSAGFRLVLPTPTGLDADQSNNAAAIILSQKAEQKDAYKKTYDKYYALAQSGDAEAMNILGMLHLKGYIEDWSYAEGYKWIMASAEAGYEQALFNVAYLYEWGINCDIDYSLCKDIYQYLSDKGNMTARAMLGRCYILGMGVAQDYATAKRLIQESADTKNPKGLLWLGILQNTENEANKDTENTNAIDAFMACIEGDSKISRGEALYWLGDWFNKMSEREADTLAFDFAKLGYEHGDPGATFLYIDLLDAGKAYPQDLRTRAAVMYEYYNNPLPTFDSKAAMAFNLGACYEDGYGVAKNKAKAIEWYKKSAELGDKDAMYKLVSLSNAADDKAQKLELLTWAAENNSQSAQNQLIYLYETDTATATYWLERMLQTPEEELQNVDYSTAETIQKKLDVLERYHNQKKEKNVPELFKGKYTWKNMDNFLLSPQQTLAKYGQNSEEYAISNFCAYQRGRYLLNSYFDLAKTSIWACDSMETTFNQYRKIIDNSTKYTGAEKADMYRLMGDVYSFDIVSYATIEANNRKDIKKFLRNTDGYHTYCGIVEDAYQCYEEAVKLYKQVGQQRSKAYLDALLGRTFIEMMIISYSQENFKKEDHPFTITSSVNALLEIYTGIRRLLLNAPDEQKRMEYWKEYQPLFATHIPMMAYVLDVQYAPNNPTMSIEKEVVNGLIYESILLSKSLNNTSDFKTATTLLMTTWEDIQKSLQPGEVAIEFKKVKRPYIDGVGAKYIAAIITPTCKCPIITDLADEKQLLQEVNRTDFKNQKQGIYEWITFSSLIWKPIQNIVKNSSRIYFSPDELFYNIAIENIPFMGGDYVDQVWDLRRLSSTHILLNMPEHKKHHNALLVGGLDFGTQRAYSRNDVNNLPESKVEVENIYSLMSQRKTPANLVVGSNGTELAFSQAAPQATLLHIATHGYDWTNPQLHLMELQQWKGINVTDNRQMLRTGIYFSGVNNTFHNLREADPTNDGILSGAEIAKLNLKNVDLAVVSACNSGKGVVSAEGISSIQTAFKKAGVKTTLTSLWEIDDKATRLFMEEFYKHYLAGDSPIVALSKARKYMREYTVPFEKYPALKIHPYRDSHYWAGFILQDAPR